MFTAPAATVTFPGELDANVSLTSIIALLRAQVPGIRIDVLASNVAPQILGGTMRYLSMYGDIDLVIDKSGTANEAFKLSTTADTRIDSPSTMVNSGMSAVAVTVEDQQGRLALETLPNPPRNTPLMIGHIVRQADTGGLYLLKHMPSSDPDNWIELGSPGPALTTVLSDAIPLALGTASGGTVDRASRANHVHPHGDQAGGTLHALATAETHGFMPSAHFAKVVSLPATNVTIAGAPVAITRAPAAPGTSPTASASDHKHDITTAAPVAVGTANAEGGSTALARADHTHDASHLAPLLYALKTLTTATYTPVLTDVGQLVLFDSAATQTVTIPTQATVAFAIGATITLAQMGTGAVQLVPAAGVTLHGWPELGGRYSAATIVKVAANTWLANTGAPPLDPATKADVALGVNAQTGTAYTLVASDVGKLVTLDNAAAQTVTLPALGSGVVLIAQLGTGTVTVVPAEGVTIRPAQAIRTRARDSVLSLMRLSATVWLASGDMGAA